MIPTVLGESSLDSVIPLDVQKVIQGIDHYFVESEKIARRYLIRLGLKKPLNEIRFYLLNEHTDPRLIPDQLKQIPKGSSVGIISDAGCPGVADPGAEVVRLVHQKGWTVIPLVGPSSILLALMGSGLSGQNFAFTGYLPVKSMERRARILELERLVYQKGQTQIFMEAPYRNDSLFADILEVCRVDTRLCVAADLTLESAMLKTQTMNEWKKSPPDLHKRPTIFVMGR